MAAFEATATAIESRFKANWLRGQCPIWWDNAPQNRPSAGRYVRFFVDEGESRQIGMPDTVRNVGLIVAEIHIPKGESPRLARADADRFAAIFDRQKFSGIQCRVASVRRAGQVEDRFRFIVTVPFYTTTQS
jgi:hypothetical protein